MAELTLRKCDWMDDWYVIERAEHDGREWMEATGPNSMAFRTSARFSDADVEGTAFEMRAIGEAIKARTGVRFKRCAVSFGEKDVEFWSPRNSQRRGRVSVADADDLAKQIRALCGELPLLAPAPTGGCMRWGLCDTGEVVRDG